MATVKQEEVKVDVNELLAKLLVEVSDLRQQVNNQTAKVPADEPSNIRRADHPESGGGWIITTPRQEYSGVTMHIEFRGGLGIVDEDLDNADFIVDKLEQDFGYGVRVADAKELNGFRKYMAGVKTKETKTMGEKLVSPGYR